MLAFADMPAKLLRLLEGHPDRRGKALGHRLAPEHQHIDPLIGDAVRAQWPCGSPCGMGRAPGLEPRPHALLQLRNDTVRNAGINICIHWSFS
jgi:hypothetical protein